MVECDLLAILYGVRMSGRFCFAMPVWITAALYPRPHEILFAGDAAAPREGRKQQQR